MLICNSSLEVKESNHKIKQTSTLHWNTSGAGKPSQTGPDQRMFSWSRNLGSWWSLVLSTSQARFLHQAPEATFLQLSPLWRKCVCPQSRFFSYLFLIFIVFSPLHLVPLHPAPPSNHHTVVHVHERKSWILSLATNTVSLSWNDRLILFVFEKLSARYSLCIITIYLSIFLSSKNGAPWKKWPVQLTVQTIAETLSLETAIALSSTEVPDDNSYFVPQNI